MSDKQFPPFRVMTEVIGLSYRSHLSLCQRVGGNIGQFLPDCIGGGAHLPETVVILLSSPQGHYYLLIYVAGQA